MLVDALESMMRGEDGYPRAFAAAKTFWDIFYAEHDEENDAELRSAVDQAQLHFEHEVGDASGLTRPFVKSIMLLTAVAALYNDGFENPDLVKRVLKAFASSTSLSIDVKSHAKAVAAMYGLTDF